MYVCLVGERVGCSLIHSFLIRLWGLVEFVVVDTTYTGCRSGRFVV